MKQLETTKVNVGENTFYITPFPAFKSANISGKLFGLITPVIASLAPLAVGNSSALDIDIEKAAPLIASGLSSISGDKVEDMLKTLLLGGNIAVSKEGYETVRMDEDIANEIFTGDTQDMFILAFHVIKINFSGFFTKILSQFGIKNVSLDKVKAALKNTENSI